MDEKYSRFANEPEMLGTMRDTTDEKVEQIEGKMNQIENKIDNMLTDMKGAQHRRYVQYGVFFAIILALVVVLVVYSTPLKSDIQTIDNAVKGLPKIQTQAETVLNDAETMLPKINAQVETLLQITLPHITAQVETVLNTTLPDMQVQIEELLLQASQTLTVVQSIESTMAGTS